MKKLIVAAFAAALYSTAALACHENASTTAQKKDTKAPVAAKKVNAKSVKQQQKKS